MSLLSICLLFSAGFLSGMVNAIAGGGTFLTFGALTLAGLPPIVANATSSIAQFPGYITSTLAYWSDIKKFWRGALVLRLISAVGAMAGALILLALDNPSFRAMVPWLLLGATALFAAGPWLKPKPKPGRRAAGAGSPRRSLVQFFTADLWRLLRRRHGRDDAGDPRPDPGGDYHRLNALKNMLAIVIAAVAIVVFVSGGVVAWPEAVIMVPGGALGGYAGVWIGQARAAESRCAASSSPSACFSPSIISPLG